MAEASVRQVRGSRLVPNVALALATVAMLLAASTLVRASNGDQIHACVNPAGRMRIVDDVSECRGNEELLSWDREGAGMPAGMVAFFNLPGCPAGWDPLASAKGRTIVGGGEVGAQRLPAFANGEVRVHSHPATTTSSVADHTHSMNVASESFPVQPNPGGPFAADAAHVHEVAPAGGHSHSVDTPSAPGHLPYLQLLACQKGT